MKKNKILVFVFIIIIILIAYIVFSDKLLKFTNISSKQFPPSNIECFNNFMERESGGYYDSYGFRMPSFNTSDVLYFRCASSIGFNQYEISGIDRDGHSFYVHRELGGMASSGADSIYNICYKQDDNIIINEKHNGREALKEVGTCVWTDNFPSNPTSIYKYKK